MDADLIFPEAGHPEGFSTLAMAQWDGKPEPIIRELLQNCLDAGRQAKRATAEIVFTIAERPLDSLPGIGRYRETFQAAAEERKGGPQSAGEQATIARIKAVLDSKRVKLLYCRDNGIGLDGDLLDRVLAEGNTSKTTGGGTTGVGHLTAFAASDLRYVLYAGRSRGEGGALRDAVSGHAILASHRSREDANIGIGGDGFLLRRGQPGLFSQGDKFVTEAPPLLAEQLEDLDDSGSVVCIAGFNDFRDDADEVVASIEQVSAVHFLAAIAQGEMVVRIAAEGGSEAIVDRRSLGRILERRKGKQRARNVFLAGAQAYRAWEVFEEGERLRVDGQEGLSIRFRERRATEQREYSRVQLYRDGMWITNKAPRLTYDEFNDCQPFDAVVVLESGDLYELVRNAEGPEHLGLHRERLGTGWKALREGLGEVGERLRERAGQRERTEEFVPDGFAVVEGKVLRIAEPVRQYRPRQPVDDTQEADTTTTGD